MKFTSLFPAFAGLVALAGATSNAAPGAALSHVRSDTPDSAPAPPNVDCKTNCNKPLHSCIVKCRMRPEVCRTYCTCKFFGNREGYCRVNDCGPEPDCAKVRTHRDTVAAPAQADACGSCQVGINQCMKGCNGWSGCQNWCTCLQKRNDAYCKVCPTIECPGGTGGDIASLVEMAEGAVLASSVQGEADQTLDVQSLEEPNCGHCHSFISLCRGTCIGLVDCEQNCRCLAKGRTKGLCDGCSGAYCRE